MGSVFVIGAGPAGLFAAHKMAKAGHEVVLFNRDIKPGGLAEYGIYPVKDKMKNGLRKQFDKMLALPNLHYFGHVPVGANFPVPIDMLREFNPQALVFAIGAQGVKRLGLPGEDARGVFPSKDFVYHYNQLPPFASQDFTTGKRIAVIGMGNVMVDIARWLLQDDPNRITEEVIVVARRGPFEAKFDEHELAHIHMHIDRKGFQDELLRVKERCSAVGQDVSKATEATFPSIHKNPSQDLVQPKLTFRFLCSPTAIHKGPDGRIARLVVTENLLVEKNGGVAAKATDKTEVLDVDTLIFAIGDVVDESVGLPSAGSGYVTNPDQTDPKRASYELYDPKLGRRMDGMYVVGWSRKASDGLVGLARMDGESGANFVLEYLALAPQHTPATPTEVYDSLTRRGIQLVTKQELEFLHRAEMREADKLGTTWFKWGEDRAMLAAIEAERSAPIVATASND